MENSTNDGFLPSKPSLKMRMTHDQTIPLKNKILLLKDNETGHPMDQNGNPDSTQAEGASPGSSSCSNEKVQTKNKIHPFLIEISAKCHELANRIKDLNEEKPLMKMDGEHLKVLCKNDNDFVKHKHIFTASLLHTLLSPLTNLNPIKYV